MAVESGKLRATYWVLLLIVAVMSILPFLWIFLGSFKPHDEIQDGRLWPWQGYAVSEDTTADVPDESETADATGEAQPDAQTGSTHPGTGSARKDTKYVTLENYRKILSQLSGLPTYYFNTFYLSIFGTFGALLVGTLAAYGFARFPFRGNRVLYTLLLLTIMIPMEVTLIGRFELMFRLNLFDRIAGLLISYIAGNLLLVIFIMRNVFITVPRDLMDAAMMDGASTWRVFWDVMIPIGGNGLAACAILTFMNIWNEFLFALTFTFRGETRTLPVGITMLKGQYGQFDSGVLFATVLLSFLPIVIVFMLLQKYFIRGLSSGALKG